MSLRNNPNDNFYVDFGSEFSKNLVVHTNVKQEIIITTEDKIKLVLIKTKKSLSAGKDWITPAGLMLSFIATLCTADFQPAFGASADFWHAIFTILLFISVIWFLYSLVRVYKFWDSDVDKIFLEEIKLKEASTENFDNAPNQIISKHAAVLFPGETNKSGAPPPSARKGKYFEF